MLRTPHLSYLPRCRTATLGMYVAALLVTGGCQVKDTKVPAKKSPAKEVPDSETPGEQPVEAVRKSRPSSRTSKRLPGCTSTKPGARHRRSGRSGRG